MISVYAVLFTLVLFSELSGPSVAVAVPVGDGIADPDGLGPLLSAEPAAGLPLSKRSRRLVDDVRDEDGSRKIIVLSDARLRGLSDRGLNPASPRGLPLLTDRSLSHAPAEYSLKVDRRDADMLRCMIGRVYRPCWEV